MKRLEEFNLDRALNGAKVVTRKGSDVQGLRVMEEIADGFHVIGVVSGKLMQWTPEGCSADETNDFNDLYILHEECVGWVNVHRDMDGNLAYGPRVFTDVESAEAYAMSYPLPYVCTTVINWGWNTNAN